MNYLIHLYDLLAESDKDSLAFLAAAHWDEFSVDVKARYRSIPDLMERIKKIAPSIS